MKKLLVSVFAIALVIALTLTGCTSNDSETLDDYKEALKNTAPAGAEISIEVETAIGTLLGSIDVSYNDDGSSKIKYSYEKFNEIGASEEKSTLEGEVSCDKDGNLSGSVNGTVDTAAKLELKLSDSLLEELTMNNGVCSAVVKADNTAKVFGINMGADVKLVLYKVDGKITMFSVAYRSTEGAVSIVCEYK
jgi:hypothetical protein